MIILGNVLIGLAFVLKLAMQAYFYIILASAILSWVNADPYNPIVRLIRSATDPVYRPIRRRFPFLVAGGIDFTPVALIAAIYFLEVVLVGSLYEYGSLLKGRVF
ncbi:MAG: YggT family protein [Candidatus Hydrogenedentota bacterium]|nr:MAG: YggT family protein [Candidatus Hydrogenedentota bacterium]